MPYVKQITIRSTLNRSLKYIVNDSKTDYGCFVTGVNCATHDKLAYKQMIENKRKHNKEKGTLGFHFIQSFKENEIEDPYKVHEIGLKWAEKMFGNKYQFIISTHLDKGHYHNHVIINSVSLEGKKFNACKQSLKDAREYSDEIAKQYNLNVIPFNKDAVPKSYKEWNEEKRGDSWKAHIKNDINAVIKSSKSFNDFMEKMEQLGYTMKQGHVKYMTFKAPGMERSVRGKTLGPEFTEERIKERIQFNEFNFEESKPNYKYRFVGKTNRNQLIDEARQFRFKRGSLAVNFMLTIALLRTIRDRNNTRLTRKNSKRDFRLDLQISKLSNHLKYISERDYKNREDIKLAADLANKQIEDITIVLKDASEISEKMSIILQTIETYNKYKPVYEEVKASTIKKMLLKNKYSVELETFDKALKQLKKLGITEQDFHSYSERYSNHGKKMEQLKVKLESIRNEISKLAEIEKALDQRSHLLQEIRSVKERSEGKGENDR